MSFACDAVALLWGGWDHKVIALDIAGIESLVNMLSLLLFFFSLFSLLFVCLWFSFSVRKFFGGMAWCMALSMQLYRCVMAFRISLFASVPFCMSSSVFGPSGGSCWARVSVFSCSCFAIFMAASLIAGVSK